MGGTLYARLYNRDALDADALRAVPPDATLHRTPAGDGGAADDRQPESADNDDELRLDEDQMVVD